MIIPLTRGQVAIIDDEDAEKILQYKWYSVWNRNTKSYYPQASIKVDGKFYQLRLSRLIMGLERGDKRQVDHRNHNTLDNKKENLRIVTNQQNSQNRSGVKGYNFDKARNKWMARIKVDGKLMFLGRFMTESEAKNTYLNARAKYFTVDTL